MNGSYYFVSPVLGNGSGPSSDSMLPRLFLDKAFPWRRKGAFSLFAFLKTRLAVGHAISPTSLAMSSPLGLFGGFQDLVLMFG